VGAPVLQLRVPEDTLARIDANRGEDTRSAWVVRLIGRQLNGPGPAQVTNEPSVTATPLVLPPGRAMPGVACSGPDCWNRDCARYGLRRLILCTACAAALQDRVCKRELPEGAARAVHREVRRS
jgi:hypothetical protein